MIEAGGMRGGGREAPEGADICMQLVHEIHNLVKQLYSDKKKIVDILIPSTSECDQGTNWVADMFGLTCAVKLSGSLSTP